MINEGVPALRKYVVDYAGRLDVEYTQARTTELINFYNQLVADVKSIKEGSSGSTCNLDCLPNWAVKADVCQCTCNVTGCDQASESVDLYHCKCVANNGCTLTQQACAADGDKVLDYTNCACAAAA